MEEERSCRSSTFVDALAAIGEYDGSEELARMGGGCAEGMLPGFVFIFISFKERVEEASVAKEGRVSCDGKCDRREQEVAVPKRHEESNKWDR